MKVPPRLQSLVEVGLIDTVVRPLMSGKEAMVFEVRCGDETLFAKIYKEATHRSFRQALDWTENRKFKNSRSARATAAVLREIGDARDEEAARGLRMTTPSA